MYENIKVAYETVDTVNDTISMLNSIPIDHPTAFDFETANKYTKEDIMALQSLYDVTEDKFKRIELLQQIKADGLSHPALTIVTHLSVAWSNNKAIVFITLNNDIRKLIYDYLVDTPVLQLWHKALFDFRHIYYHTGKLPKDYFDVQLYVKSLTNNVNVLKSRTSLKVLMASKYGEWSESKDSNFVIEDAYNPDMLLYAATDACALYECYQDWYINKRFKL